jgi:hypothetical protein
MSSNEHESVEEITSNHTGQQTREPNLRDRINLPKVIVYTMLALAVPGLPECEATVHDLRANDTVRSPIEQPAPEPTTTTTQALTYTIPL